ncbi:MAG: NAD-dependent epimerase/dehydratase family protein [Candidatus Hydrogenedentes bacterium]|nr:NAD-dependent epimerase/dehydratase family protein [Candidatus Hydrogenedentota bacterium]
MNCTIIGGAGFIGTRTALKLVARGHSIRILDALDPQIHGLDISASEMLASVAGKIPVTVGDVRDPAAIRMALDAADVVYYFAAGTGTGQSMYQVRKYTEINVLGAAVLGEELALRKGQIRRVVISSSRAVYGEGAYTCTQHGRIFPRSRDPRALEEGEFTPLCPHCAGSLVETASLESDPVQPSSIYGITKLAQEQIILNLCESLGIPAVALRYQNVFGPGQSLKNPYTGILSIFSQQLLQDKPINVFEDGRPTRDFIYIDDIAEFNCRAGEKELHGSHICNVGTGVRQTLLDVVDVLAQTYGRKPDYRISGQFRLGDIRHAAADTTHLRRVLGEHTFVSFSEGITRFADWVRRQNIEQESNARYARSLEEMASIGLLRGGSVERSKS